jgi:hypothetical protein
VMCQLMFSWQHYHGMQSHSYELQTFCFVISFSFVSHIFASSLFMGGWNSSRQNNAGHDIQSNGRLKSGLCSQHCKRCEAVPLHSMVALGGKRRYSSYSFTTSALDGGEWSASRPGRSLPPVKGPRYPLYRRLGGPQSRSGHRG